MSIVRVTILTLLSLLIAGAAFIGQLAFRMDRTFLGFGYTQDALERWLSPLKNDEIRRDFVDDLLDDMRRALDWSMPSQLQAIMDDAAFENFSYDWMMNTVRRMHISVFRLMKGDNLSMELVIPLGGFTNTMVSMVRQDIPAEFSRQIESQLTRTPSSIDVWQSIDEEARVRAERWIRRIPLLSILLQYALPGAFMLLTLALGRPGSALVSSGAGMLLSGGAMLVYVRWFSAGIPVRVASMIQVLLPGRPLWVREPVAESVAAAIQSATGFAWILGGIGLVVALMGILVIRRWGDSFSVVAGAAGHLLKER